MMSQNEIAVLRIHQAGQPGPISIEEAAMLLRWCRGLAGSNEELSECLEVSWPVPGSEGEMASRLLYDDNLLAEARHHEAEWRHHQDA